LVTINSITAYKAFKVPVKVVLEQGHWWKHCRDPDLGVHLMMIQNSWRLNYGKWSRCWLGSELWACQALNRASLEIVGLTSFERRCPTNLHRAFVLAGTTLEVLDRPFQ
jgi:hypothetical protein